MDGHIAGGGEGGEGGGLSGRTGTRRRPLVSELSDTEKEARSRHVTDIRRLHLELDELHARWHEFETSRGLCPPGGSMKDLSRTCRWDKEAVRGLKGAAKAEVKGMCSELSAFQERLHVLSGTWEEGELAHNLYKSKKTWAWLRRARERAAFENSAI